MRYSCLAPGKRIRPILCMVSAEALGMPPYAVIDAACAIEMVHTFSLIHDDLPALDDDDMRRGRATCHKKFGEALAILAGDALFALAYQTLTEAPHEPERLLRSLRCLSRAVGSDGLVGGEVADVQAEGKQVDAEMLEFIHTRKTGALIAASCEIGAVLGGENLSQVLAFRRYGEQLGLAFQIADDLLNELSTAETLGKAAGSDRARQKATYPSVHGVEGARKAAQEAAEKAIAEIAPYSSQQPLLRDLALYAIERSS